MPTASRAERRASRLPTVAEDCHDVVDGRKLHAGSALYGEDGRLLGKSRATWIDLGEWNR